jgi:hypothetical protein
MRSIAIRASLLILSAAAVPALAAQNFRWNGRVATGDAVEVIGISADIEATAASGSEVLVTATGLSDGAHIEVEQHSGGVTFCVVHSGMHRTGGGRCNMQGNHERRHNWNHEAIEVQVRIPAGVDFEGRTVSGSVDAQGLTGDVEAHSVSGDVRVTTRGSVEAQSVSGDVRVTMGSLPDRGTLEFKSVSGDIEITLPAGADAELRANTLSGEIESDFPLDINGRDRERGRFHVQVGSRARGTIGEGGPRIELETVSGDIRVLRRGR